MAARDKPEKAQVLRRPRNVAEVGSLARAHTVKAMETIAGIMYKGRTDNIKLKAAELLLKIGWGAGLQNAVQVVLNAQKAEELSEDQLKQFLLAKQADQTIDAELGEGEDTKLLSGSDD